jgi:hypothetical protein
MSGERRLKVCRVSQGCVDQRSELFLLRRRGRAHLLADEERLVSSLPALGHLQGLLEWLEEEGQIDSKSLRQDPAISRNRVRLKRVKHTNKVLINQLFNDKENTKLVKKSRFLTVIRV